jgi:hypothetical protein
MDIPREKIAEFWIRHGLPISSSSIPEQRIPSLFQGSEGSYHCSSGNYRKIHRIHFILFMDGWMDGGPKLNGKINHVSESTSLKISYSNWKIGPEKNLPRFCQVRIQVSRNFLSVF